GDAMIGSASSALGECLTAQKRYPEAETFLMNGYNDLKAKLGPQNRRTTDARQRLAKLYDDWGRPDQAAQFR
ncbi:MAG TPA: tetratricopeptide repeat protein, partial [Chthoniobacterales bacterium]|nr:tetratricopeptide repeat protein [Chthoniobacterales bacterium]